MFFEVPEDIFESLERLIQDGVEGAELCKAWLGAAVPRDEPVLMHVFGVRSSGAPVDLLVECQPHGAQHPAVTLSRRRDDHGAA